MGHSTLIYNRTKDSPNNQPCSHTNGYAWDNNLYSPLPHHDDNDVLEPCVDDDVLLRESYGLRLRVVRVLLDLQGLHVELQMLVLLSLK